MNTRLGYQLASLLGVFAIALCIVSLLNVDATRSVIWFAVALVVMALGFVVYVMTFLLKEATSQIILEIQNSQSASSGAQHTEDPTAS